MMAPFFPSATWALRAALLFAQLRQFPLDPPQAASFAARVPIRGPKESFLHLQLQDLAIDLIDLLGAWR